MSNAISLALVGIGGYGNGYVNALLDSPNPDGFRLVAGIDPSPSTCQRLAELRSRDVPIYPSLEAFHAAGRAELVIISSPIQFHARQTVAALAQGSHVLCEKPLCATLDEAKQMREARDAAGKLVAIGYQWSFGKAVQELKADILAGRLGAAKRLRCLTLWPRDEQYYKRNAWAGAARDPQGNWVLDSPVNNACAHHLHNMLYVLGPAVDQSAKPALLVAELYRANEIGNYDTAALRCRTGDGVELLFLTSHACAVSRGPIFSYEFEKATVDFVDGPGSTIAAHFHDGTERTYGPPIEARDRKLWMTMDDIRHGTRTVCGIEAASAHTQCVWAAHQSQPKIAEFPSDCVQVSGDAGKRKTSVSGLPEALTHCYAEWKLPSELEIDWAVRGREVSVNGLAGA